jgi:predicted glycosyltransferase
VIVSGDAGFSGLADASKGRPIDDVFKTARRDVLLDAFRQARPDIVMIEAFPFGRRQVRFELIPLLDEIAATDRSRWWSPRFATYCRSAPSRAATRKASIWSKQYFDRVLVHGDPGFARLEDTFPLTAAIADRIVYTGLVAAPAPMPASEIFDIVVSAGGGAVGNGLIRAALGAAKALPETYRWCIITGPNLPQADFDAIVADGQDNVSVFRFRQDFASLLGAAQLSVSQAGYNTVCDILRAGCHALLIPFVAGGETEQTVRAERFEKLGLATVLTEAELSVESMTTAIGAALMSPKPSGHGLDLDGAHRTAEILRGLVEGR